MGSMNLGARQKRVTLRYHLPPSSSPAVQHLNSLAAWSWCSRAACTWPATQTGKCSTRRDEPDVSTKAWQLLWEPMAMLPQLNKPQGQQSNGLQRGAGNRDSSDIKGHPQLQRQERGPVQCEPQACGVLIPLQCPHIMLTARPRLHKEEQCESNPASRGCQRTSRIHPLESHQACLACAEGWVQSSLTWWSNGQHWNLIYRQDSLQDSNPQSNNWPVA